MVFVHLLIGVAAATTILVLFELSRERQWTVAVWGWALAVLGVIYTAFTLEVIATLLDEGAPQAALVSGILLGLIAVIGWVLMGRFVFVSPAEQA
jgi:hypothetical protein